MAQPPIRPTWNPAAQVEYRTNIAALGWGELWHVLGNPLAFVVMGPLILLAKLFRFRLGDDSRLAREVRLVPANPTFLTRADRVNHLFYAVQALGYQHFGTFRIVGASATRLS